MISMNREYLGKLVKKGTFLCRYTKVGGFDIGKNAIEETDSYPKLINFQMGQPRHMTLQCHEKYFKKYERIHLAPTNLCGKKMTLLIG